MRKHEYRLCIVMLFLASAIATQAQGTTIKSFTYGATVGTLDRYCSACHSWSSTYESLIGSGVVIPGKPKTSPALQYIESGQMPPAGSAPSQPEIQSLFSWILAGAPKPAADAISGATGATATPATVKPADAVSGATVQATSAAPVDAVSRATGYDDDDEEDEDDDD